MDFYTIFRSPILIQIVLSSYAGVIIWFLTVMVKNYFLFACIDFILLISSQTSTITHGFYDLGYF